MTNTQQPTRRRPPKRPTVMSERTLEPSGWIVLECSGCREHLVLLGLEEDWSKEHRDAFECSECDKTVTLADRVDGTAYTVRALLKNSIRPFTPGPFTPGA